MNGKKFLFLFILSIFFIQGTFAQDVGSRYTDFSSVTADGTPVKLSGFAGKVIFLDFWASWCKPCKAEFPYLVTLYNDYKDSGFAVVAVNVDNEKSKLEDFIANLGIDVPFTVISDTEGKLPQLYNLDAMPTSFIIDKKGIIRYKHTGFELSDKETYVQEITGLLNSN